MADNIMADLRAVRFLLRLPVALTSSVPCLGNRQDENLNVTRKIFLEALGVTVSKTV